MLNPASDQPLATVPDACGAEVAAAVAAAKRIQGTRPQTLAFGLTDSPVDVPMGYAEFPREILRPPRSIAARLTTDIRRWTTLARGGHFAALEQPEVLAEEIRSFFRPLRDRA